MDARWWSPTPITAQGTGRPAGSPPHRLACSGCGATGEWRARRERNYVILPAFSGPDDPYFRRPLWLQTTCCGGRALWAYNERHLDLLEAYVAAHQRVRGRRAGSGSMLERLPTWIKAADNRTEILKAIRGMRSSP